MHTPSFQPDALTIPENPLAESGARTFAKKFTPHRYLTSGHAQTLVGNFLPRPPLTLRSIDELIVVDPADNSRILCHCHWQPEKSSRLTIVLVHGLEGSSNSQYIRGLTQRAWDSGCNVVRMNMRNCGDTDQLTPTLYHSGLSDDVGAVLETLAKRHNLQQFALIGYSMGGNLVLKLAGEWGKRAQRLISGIATVSPVIDLAPSADSLNQSWNRIYERHFLRGLKRRYLRKVELYPHLYAADAIEPVHSIRTFDEHIVSRYCSFTGADDYYHRAAAARVIDRIAVPTLVLHALNDPFIRLTEATRKLLIANPSITFQESAHGGHCAFLSTDKGEEIHWAESTAVRFLLSAGTR